jgi:hypothetical protein
MAATPAASKSDTWFAPSSEELPNWITLTASKTISMAIGTNASARDGDLTSLDIHEL